MAKNYALLPDAVTMYTQTEALKDMSKNLMNGDYEREHRSGAVERRKHRQTCLATLAVAVGALTLWLLVLTVIREVQITRLRRDLEQLARLRSDLDQLTVNMIAMSATVNSLNQKLNNNRLFNEFKTLEDTIYADEDQDNLVTIDEKVPPNDYDSLEKLHKLTTVLEDEADAEPDTDDEDLYDDEDDGESGDWYQEYDRKREKIGTSNMVRLKPEDFGGSVVTLGKDKQDDSVIRQLRKMLNENPENPDITLPSLAPVTEPTEDARNKRSVQPDSTADSMDKIAVPSVMAKSEDRRKTKKFTPESAPPSKLALHTVSRIARNSDDEASQRRLFVAAHFHGNTSHLNTEIHEHYKGNGLVRVAHDQPHNVWYPSQWTLASHHPRPTLTRSGHVHVHHTGVYLVYVQIYYLDTHDIISWVLHRTNAEIEGRETLLQCAQSSHSSEPLEKPNSCFSAAALFLRAGDRLAVRNTGGDRHSLMQPEKSFIGLIKLADAEDPTQEL